MRSKARRAYNSNESRIRHRMMAKIYTALNKEEVKNKESVLRHFMHMNCCIIKWTSMYKVSKM